MQLVEITFGKSEIWKQFGLAIIDGTPDASKAVCKLCLSKFKIHDNSGILLKFT